MNIIAGLKGNDLLIGGRDDDTLVGDGGIDDGGALATPIIGDDVLLGADGNDTLFGGQGDDALIGGRGVDSLSGGEGADVFIFLSKTSSPNDAFGHFDTIHDFTRSEGDLIDLSHLRVKGDNDLTFIGGQRFSGDAGEVRFAKDGRLLANLDGDSPADFKVIVENATLGEADLIL